MNESNTQSAANESVTSDGLASNGVALSKEVNAQGAARSAAQASESGHALGATTASAADADKAARNWAVAAHLSGLSLYLGVPFGNILGPLVIWLIKQGESPYAEQQAKEALNFQISLTLYGVAAGLLAFVFIGFLLIPVLFVLHIVLTIVATVKASEGEPYEYPLTIRLVS